MFSSALLFLNFIFIFQYFASSQNIETQIISGDRVKPGEIPYQISLQTSYSNFHFCGGSLISPLHVVTAGHCVENLKPGDIYVVAGTVNLDKPKYIRKITEIIIHENYNPGDSWHNDIALIKLSSPLLLSEVIGYAFLPKQNETFAEGITALVSGFGRLSDNGPRSRYLMKAINYIASQQYCKQMYKKVQNNIRDSQVCAYNSENRTGACNGDSGGPLIVNGKLVGIVSWSLGCSLTDFPTVFTRVSSYANWINRHIFSQLTIE